MPGVTNNFLFDAIVLVATLQSATSERQFLLADEKVNDNPSFLGSIGTKEGKRSTISETFIEISRTHR